MGWLTGETAKTNAQRRRTWVTAMSLEGGVRATVADCPEAPTGRSTAPDPAVRRTATRAQTSADGGVPRRLA